MKKILFSAALVLTVGMVVAQADQMFVFPQRSAHEMVTGFDARSISIVLSHENTAVLNSLGDAHNGISGVVLSQLAQGKTGGFSAARLVNTMTTPGGRVEGPQPVIISAPEPAALLLMGSGLVALAGGMRRKLRK